MFCRLLRESLIGMNGGDFMFGDSTTIIAASKAKAAIS